MGLEASAPINSLTSLDDSVSWGHVRERSGERERDPHNNSGRSLASRRSSEGWREGAAVGGGGEQPAEAHKLERHLPTLHRQKSLIVESATETMAALIVKRLFLTCS
jgi:hypothetical protein